MRSFAAQRVAVFPIAVASAAFFWWVINTSGPATAFWLVGLTLIGLVWLVRRRGLPANSATALLVVGFTMLCLVAIGGATLFGARYGMAWKGTIFGGVAIYLLGYALALRETASRQVRLGRFLAIAVVVVALPFGFSFLTSPWPNQVGQCDGFVPEWWVPDDYDGGGCVEVQPNLIGLGPWNWGKWREVCIGLCGPNSLVWDPQTRTWDLSP